MLHVPAYKFTIRAASGAFSSFQINIGLFFMYLFDLYAGNHLSLSLFGNEGKYIYSDTTILYPIYRYNRYIIYT